MDHQPSSIQISPGQLQNELESIRSLRRISLSQPSSDLDPDLPSGLQIDPNPSNHSSSNNPPQGSPSHPSSDSGSDSSLPSDQPHPDLFWLPARLHPEIAPQEFKAFIEEATKPENLLRRTSSALGSRRPNSNDPSNPTSITRKKSMLSKVYHPSEHEHLPSLPSKSPSDPSILRGYSMSSPNHRGRGAQGLDTLTINDLQKLEALVLKKPSPHSPSDPNLESELQTLNLYDHRIKSIISRSLSLGGNPTASRNDSEVNLDPADSEAIDDSPLISRAPGHIIRRTARTKVRKPLLPGDGNGHRFPATRRNQAKSPLLTSSSGTVSIASNTSEETSTGDLPSNRDSSECIQKSNDSIPSTVSDDHLGPGIGATDGKLASQRPPLNPLSASKSSQTSLLDGPPHQPQPSSEDDQSISSTSRPDSVISNSSLLDAYTYEGTTTNDPTAAINFGNFDLNESSIPPSKIDLATLNPLKSDLPSSADHRQQVPNDSDLLQTPTPQPLSLPPAANDQFLSYPGSSKPDGLKVVTNNLLDPFSSRTSLSSDDPLSTTTKSAVSETTVTSASAVNSNSPSGSTFPSSSPQNPLSTHPPRPILSTTKTSPNLTTPANAANTILPVPSPSVGVKEGKEKKRTWVKLGLASAVSPSSKSKKEKGKDKQKAKVDGQQTNDGSPGQSNSTDSAQSGGNTNAATGATKKEIGFLSGLFGGKSKKQDSEQDKQSASASQSTGNSKSSPNNPNHGGSNLPGEAQGQQQLINPTASGGYIKGRFMSFYRLPIHVERAVYRLSHIKLANPRRPLYEQVLISNLMFWYLGVINKAQSAPPVNNQHQPSTAVPAPSPGPPGPSSSNHKPNNGNRQTEKTKTSPSSQTKSPKRGPGIKTNWKKNQSQGTPISSNAAASSSSSGITTTHKEWIEPDSSESSDSEGEEQQTVDATRRRGTKGVEEKAKRVSSSSSSSSSTNSSSDDDERPLGSRIGLSKQIQMNQAPSSSKTNSNSNNTSNKLNQNNTRNNNNNLIHNKNSNNAIGYNSRSNPVLAKPKTNNNLIAGFVNSKNN